MQPERVLILGGSGRLGRALRGLLPQAPAPTRQEIDLLERHSLARGLQKYRPKVVVNATGYTDVLKAEWEREKCWAANVVGVQNLVRELFAWDCGLLQVSTDYVFDGQQGMYRESDVPGPVCNYYSLTKLAGEQVAFSLPASLIVRTSFREGCWPHPVAFQDLFTSQDYLDVIAPDFVLLLQHWGEFPDKILHIASERKSAYELARRRKPEVQPGWRKDAAVALPYDISLNVSRWRLLKKIWSKESGELHEPGLRRVDTI